jgi:hypothetical protein
MVVAHGAGRAPGGEFAALLPDGQGLGAHQVPDRQADNGNKKHAVVTVRGLSFDDRGRRHRIAGASIQGHLTADLFNVNDVV